MLVRRNGRDLLIDDGHHRFLKQILKSMMAPRLLLLLVTTLCALATARGYCVHPARAAVAGPRTRPRTLTMTGASPVDGLVKSASIFASKLQAGDNFKQALADGIAGEYDRAAADAEISRLVDSAPVVVFSWTISPFSKKAKDLLKVAGVEPVVVELDQPLDKGNPLRAELGRRTGRTSVPSVWIGGQYVGGCDDGPTADAPGIIKLAFSGKLREKLAAAGALKQEEAIPAAPLA
jgi:glutaredoxin 3